MIRISKSFILFSGAPFVFMFYADVMRRTNLRRWNSVNMYCIVGITLFFVYVHSFFYWKKDFSLSNMSNLPWKSSYMVKLHEAVAKLDFKNSIFEFPSFFWVLLKFSLKVFPLNEGMCLAAFRNFLSFFYE